MSNMFKKNMPYIDVYLFISTPKLVNYLRIEHTAFELFLQSTHIGLDVQ